VSSIKNRLGFLFFVGLLASASFGGVASGSIITYVTPTNATNSNANWPAVNGTYSQNYGLAFQTGSSGPFDIDWVNFELNTSSVSTGSASLTIALRNATNTTAYSAVAGTTEYAKDTVSFSMPTTTATAFTLNLSAAQIPNISSFAMQSNTAYALIVYAPSVNIGMGRTTGFGNGTTNNFYTVTNGFTMLGTLRNNSPNYANSASSYPTLAISFGATQSSGAVPEPSSMAIFGLVALGIGYLARRNS
jgi:hypothetical protein